MTEQSEHLSSAQIENYGNRTSGAGPDAAQGDERQRVNHQSLDDESVDRSSDDQSMNDQHVEAHLADCPSCRNRVLDFHRSFFASPADPPETDPPETDPPENGPAAKDASLSGRSPSGHSPSGERPADSNERPADSNERSADSKSAGARPSDSALADSNFANSKYPVDPQVRTAPTPQCPSDDTLRQLAAGLTPDDVAATLTQHAATCDHCGPLLGTFTEDFSDDFTPEERAVLNNLKSGSESWQKELAKKIVKLPKADSKKDG